VVILLDMSHESSSAEVLFATTKSVMFEKENITIVMKEAIKTENEKISKKTRKRLTASSSSATNDNAIQMCISSLSPKSSSVDTRQVKGALDYGNNELLPVSGTNGATGVAGVATAADHQRCKGEKKKGGRCSRKAKNGEYCETHSTERKEMERKIEGGIYVFRCKNDLYDIEEILRRGMN
jgi:hypothetical protein